MLYHGYQLDNEDLFVLQEMLTVKIMCRSRINPMFNRLCSIP